MYVELSIETPTKLNKKQRKLLEEFAEISGDDISPESANFFGKARRFWDSLVE
jgi:molecular chaperone DnaJ